MVEKHGGWGRVGEEGIGWGASSEEEGGKKRGIKAPKPEGGLHSLNDHVIIFTVCCSSWSHPSPGIFKFIDSG